MPHADDYRAHANISQAAHEYIHARPMATWAEIRRHLANQGLVVRTEQIQKALEVEMALGHIRIAKTRQAHWIYPEGAGVYGLFEESLAALRACFHEEDVAAIIRFLAHNPGPRRTEEIRTGAYAAPPKKDTLQKRLLRAAEPRWINGRVVAGPLKKVHCRDSARKPTKRNTCWTLTPRHRRLVANPDFAAEIGLGPGESSDPRLGR